VIISKLKTTVVPSVNYILNVPFFKLDIIV